MVIAEVVGEPVRLIRALADRPGPERLENLQLVPQVLDLFAPLVKIFRRGIAPRGPEGLAALAVHTLQPGTDHGPSMVPDRPARGTLVYPAECVALGLERCRLLHNAASCSDVLRAQRTSQTV